MLHAALSLPPLSQAMGGWLPRKVLQGGTHALHVHSTTEIHLPSPASPLLKPSSHSASEKRLGSVSTTQQGLLLRVMMAQLLMPAMGAELC